MSAEEEAAPEVRIAAALEEIAVSLDTLALCVQVGRDDKGYFRILNETEFE